MIPQKWGFCMEGNEEAFCRSLDIADQPGKFIYYEIGIGNGDTMEAVDSWLTQKEKDHLIIGVDLPDYSGSCLHKGWGRAGEVEGNICLALFTSEIFLANASRKANFIFIDACHGAPCVTRDFLLAEKLIKPGGVIAFHDTDPSCQGQHFQEHCGTGIDVRAALEALGLLNGTREGWRMIEETWPSKPGNHGAAFFQKM